MLADLSVFKLLVGRAMNVLMLGLSMEEGVDFFDIFFSTIEKII